MSHLSFFVRRAIGRAGRVFFGMRCRLLVAGLALLASLGAGVSDVAAQSSWGDMRPAQLSPEEQAAALQRFRSLRLADTCFEFTITHIPRRGGKETVHKGVIWTSWRDDAPVFRIELTPPDGSASKKTLRYILKGGPNAVIWGLNDAGKPVKLGNAANQPFFPGLIITPLELQQPFTYWRDVKYLETRRFRGRATHFFQMNPPEDFKRAHPEIGSVRIGMDKGYDSQVLMQATIVNAKGDEVRKLEIESFNSVKGVYIPEELRLLDVASRDRDVFRVKRAAVRISYAGNIYDPASLIGSPPMPEDKHFEKID